MIANVALLPFETRGFRGVIPPRQGLLPVSLARLIWGAVTVGATPISMSATSRPLIELCWRAAMAGANLTQDATTDRWGKTNAYIRLDRSEKTAVSYFLGMLQAKITCEMLLGAPHLVHLDAVLAMLGQSTNHSRPDFVGFDLATNCYTIAVEAKGRTHYWSEAATATAKAQAQRLPTVVNTTSALRIASVAYFDDGAWNAYLEDPESDHYDVASGLSVAALLVAYYRPLVAAQLADETLEDDRSTARSLVVRIRQLDMWLGLPRSVVDILRLVPATGPVALEDLQPAGADLLGALLELPGKSAAALSTETWQSRGALEGSHAMNCTGFDGVYIELGESWSSSRT